MANDLLDFTLPQTFDAVAPTVEWRSQWNEPWTSTLLPGEAIPRVDMIKMTVGGTLGMATLRAHVGMIAEQGETVQSVKVPWSTTSATGQRKYVRLTFTPNTGPAPLTAYKWYGIVVSEQHNQVGFVKLPNDDEIETLDQIITCRPLEWLLTRIQIDKGHIDDGNFGADVINRAITFNDFQGNKISTASRGNRSAALTGDGYYTFSDNADVWTASQIIEHLLFFFQASASFAGNNTGIKFDLSPVALQAIDWFIPTKLVTDGRHLYEVINALIDKRRAVIWSVEISGNEAQAVIVVHPTTLTVINLPSGDTIPAANLPKDVATAGQSGGRRIVTTTDYQRKYEQIKVTGARRGGCGTFSNVDGTLVAAWTAAQETSYRTGSTTVGGLNGEDTRRAHDMFRRSKSVSNVYRHFTIPTDWDGLVNDGNNGILSTPIFPRLDSAGDPTTVTEVFWQAGLRFEPLLPLKTHQDYSVSVTSPTDNSPPGIEPEFIHAFCEFELLEDANNKRQFGHKLSAAAYSESMGDGGLEFSCNMRMDSRGPSWWITPSGMAHLIANPDFTGAAGASDVMEQLNWKLMTCTLFAEFDEHLVSVYPDDPDPSQNDMTAVLDIRLPDLRLDYVARGTIYDIEDGDPKRVSVGGFVRDDRDKADDIARAAWQWYGTPRKALSMQFDQISTLLTLGDYIENVDGEAVNTNVTQIVWDFVAQRTTIDTGFTEFDFRAL